MIKKLDLSKELTAKIIVHEEDRKGGFVIVAQGTQEEANGVWAFVSGASICTDLPKLVDPQKNLWQINYKVYTGDKV